MLARGSLLLVALFVLGMILPGVLGQPPAASGTGTASLEAPAAEQLAPKRQPRQERVGRMGRPGEELRKASAESALCTGPGLQLLPLSGRCTHGPDPVPPRIAGSGRAERSASAQAAIPCEGDGRTGFRIQTLYLSAPGGADNAPAFEAGIQGWLSATNDIYRQNAADTGGLRNLRFVTTAGCQPSVARVQVSPAALTSFDQMVVQLTNLGFNRRDRVYLIYMDFDDPTACGRGTISPDQRRAGNLNWNNVGPSYSVVYLYCWDGSTAAHELMHNFGGVQNGAPNTSRGFHCTDEYDIMCYEDRPGLILTYPCAEAENNFSLLDCGRDDYYNANPTAGSYLAKFWNPTNNRFLIRGAPDTKPPAVRLAPLPRAVPGKVVKITAGSTPEAALPIPIGDAG